MGYNSLYIIQNFGTLCWTIFLPLAGIILAPVVVFFSKGHLAHLRNKSNHWMFFDFWVSFFDETSLFLMVCIGLNVKFNWSWSAFGDIWNSAISMLFGGLLAIFPFFVAIFYTRAANFKKIQGNDPEFMARYGSILRGLNFKRRGRLALVYAVASLLRKLWLAYILVFRIQKPVVNIL